MARVRVACAHEGRFTTTAAWIKDCNLARRVTHDSGEVDMGVKGLRLVTALFVALSTALAFCHLMQLEPRMMYTATEWRLTQSMYANFGPPVGAVLEGGAWILAVALSVIIRKRGPAFRWTLICAALMILAQVIWWTFVAPVNASLEGWSAAGIPHDWLDLRRQWEYAHAVRAGVQVAGLTALIISFLVETP